MNQDRITEEASPTLLDDSKDLQEKQSKLKQRGLERLYKKYQEIVQQSEKIKHNMRTVKPLKSIKLKESYVQRPKYWKFKKEGSPLTKQHIQNKSNDYSHRNSKSLISCFSPSRKQLSVNGSKVNMKKGNYSVNIDGYLSDKVGDGSYTENQYSFHQRVPFCYSSETRSPRQQEEVQTTNSARSQNREKSLLLERKISQYTESIHYDDRNEEDVLRSIEFKPLLKAEDLRQRSYPFNSEDRLSSSFTLSSQDSLFEENQGKTKKKCPISLFSPFMKRREFESRNLGSSSFCISRNSTRASKSRQSSKESHISRNLRIKSKIRIGGGMLQTSGFLSDESGGWSTPDRNLTKIMKSKFDKAHTKMLASFNQNLRQRMPGRLV